MNELANTRETGLSALDNLAMQAQMFSQGAALNLLQLGRVLCEAKPLVSHGEWTEWVRTNAHLPPRTAQQYMQAYHKFGLNQQYAQLGPSQIIKLLPMTDEEREELLKENDVENMTTRELDAAIKAQKEKIRAEVEREIRAEVRTEKQTAEREPEAPKELLDELERQKDENEQTRAELQRVAEQARISLEESVNLRQQKSRLEAELRENEALLQEQQDTINRTQEELFSMKSAQARGDSERETSDELTFDVASATVREFMGMMARWPYMRVTFGGMNQREKTKWSELLHTVEGWTTAAREALETVTMEGGYRIE